MHNTGFLPDCQLLSVTDGSIWIPYLPRYLEIFQKPNFHVVKWNRPTQSIIYVPLQLNRFQKSMLLIVQYKYSKSCSGDFILQNVILRTRSCSTGLITQHSWLLHFHLTEIFQTEFFCNTIVPASKGHLGGASP